MLEIRTVGVVGAGQMGHGNAHVMLRARHRVLLLDVSQDLVQAGAKRILKGLARDVEKERLTEEQRQQAVTRLKTTTMPTKSASSINPTGVFLPFGFDLGAIDFLSGGGSGVLVVKTE